MNIEQIGKNLKRIAEKKGVSKREIATATGDSENAITKWFLGLSTPRIHKINIICDLLDVTPNELFGFSSPNPKKDETKPIKKTPSQEGERVIADSIRDDDTIENYKKLTNHYESIVERQSKDLDSADIKIQELRSRLDDIMQRYYSVREENFDLKLELKTLKSNPLPSETGQRHAG